MTIDPKYPLTESEAAAEAARLIGEAYRPQPVTQFATSFRDTSRVPEFGTTPPVAQPDSRIVPEWAAGVAVASIGVGAGVTGLGCAAWLVLQGISSVLDSAASVSFLGFLTVVGPFGGVAMIVTAVGVAVSKAKRASTTNVYQGTVIKRTEITSTARGIGARSRIGE
ncbi:hypothetical protein [Streptomyces prunicolor]|uniref:Integral membrane protein n=1 Tax=Streptomyces prunicolor TaxID=67348 RepID=A0ABU4FQ84_9ACTN|nr:hypothetical protein [Streptomyces prunicolor]MDV7222745.1 hypothetical protein [Streptomyces prunicolor]